MPDHKIGDPITYRYSERGKPHSSFQHTVEAIVTGVRIADGKVVRYEIEDARGFRSWIAASDVCEEGQVTDKDPPDNVIQLGPTGPATSKVGDWTGPIKKCEHHSFMVDGRARIVECQHCGVDLDPIEVLHEFAVGERSYRMWAAEEKKVHARLKALHEDERKTKARLKNASRKDAEIAVAAERARWEERLRRIAWNAQKIEGMAKTIRNATGKKDR